MPFEQDEIAFSENIDNVGVISSISYSQACQNTSDCPPNSRCVNVTVVDHNITRGNDSVCECLKGWTTWKDGELCAYEQRSKLTTFLLSFFVGSLGVDWFYLSRGEAVYIVAGVFKSLVWCFICGCCCKRKSSDGGDGVGGCFRWLSRIFICGLDIWWLVDWIRILTNVFPDGNGVPLEDW